MHDNNAPSSKQFIQSANFVPRDGDKLGAGWRLHKDGTLEINRALVLEAKLEPVPLVWHETERLEDIKVSVGDPQAPVHTTLDLVVSIEGMLTNPAVRESLVAAIRQTVIDVLHAAPSRGMRTARLTTETTVRAQADEACASHIGALSCGVGVDLDGQARHFEEKHKDAWAGVGASITPASLVVETPGGTVTIGDLAKEFAATHPGSAEQHKKAFQDLHLNREVPLEDVPKTMGQLCRVAPISCNGKLPVNFLDTDVDDGK